MHHSRLYKTKPGTTKPGKLTLGQTALNQVTLSQIAGSVLFLVLLNTWHLAHADDTRLNATNNGAVVNGAVGKQDVKILKSQIEDFLKMETSGYPGEVKIGVVPVDPNLKLAACPNPATAMAAGSRAWGKTTVAVSCAAPKWTIYVQANVSVITDYYVAAMPLSQGHVVVNGDVMTVQGDLTKLPAGIFTDVNQVLGRTVNVSLTSGAVLRQEMLKMPSIVQQGQTVTLKTVGQGFQVSTEAKALNNAVDGQSVQVKVSSGEVITGIARTGGQVEVTF